VKPKALKEIGKAQEKIQRDYKRKRAKTSIPNRNKDLEGNKITSLGVDDMVTITPRGRAPKIQKPPTMYKVIEDGVEKTITQGKMKLTDNSVPPQTWWEPASNIGLFMRATEF